MENKKKFSFLYTTLIKALILLVIFLSLAGLIWNIYNFITVASSSLEPFNKVFRWVILLFNLALLVFMVSVVFFSYYSVDQTNLNVRFGLFVTKYKLSEISGITHFTKSDKLVIYFTDETYTVAVIKPTEYASFSGLLKGLNPQIILDTQLDLPNEDN